MKYSKNPGVDRSIAEKTSLAFAGDTSVSIIDREGEHIKGNGPMPTILRDFKSLFFRVQGRCSAEDAAVSTVNLLTSSGDTSPLAPGSVLSAFEWRLPGRKGKGAI